MEILIEIFTEMLNHIDNHQYAYKNPQWTNRQIVEAWVKTNEAKLKNIGDIASVITCVHPFYEMVSGDEGDFCCKCQKYLGTHRV